MKKFHVHITAGAENDVRGIQAYIARHNLRASRKWRREFERHAQSLSRLPHRYEIIPEEVEHEYHHALIGNYRLIYRIADDLVIIVRVIHAAQILHPSYLEQDVDKS